MRLNPTLAEWLNIIFRWTHVFAGILWIGQTYFFTWMDGRLSEEEKDAVGGSTPKIWMVHSGGFYIVEKRKTAEVLPLRLHWFRWEAAMTWLSGLLLLVVVYYLGGAMVDQDVRDISSGTATLIGLSVLIAGWLVYDFIAISPIGRSEGSFAVIGFVLLVAVTYGLSQVFSGRAAYMHAGAIMGTIMAANVWVRIIPGQRALIKAAKEGKEPDERLASRAKLRSKHNTFMVIPVVFIMISNHFPVATYGSEYNWLILSGLILAGWVAAAIIRRA